MTEEIITDEYKNGYNDCSERILDSINQIMINDKKSHESIYSILLELKELVMLRCFK